MTRMKVCFKKIRGQCYGGAAAMSNSQSGVDTRILQEEPRALYTHGWEFFIWLVQIP